MPSIRDAIQAKNSKDKQLLESRRSIVPGTLVAVDSATSTAVAGRPGYKWVREMGLAGGVFPVLAGNVDDVINLPVLMGVDPKPPYVRKVIQADWDKIKVFFTEGTNYQMSAHHLTHEFPDGNRGDDVVFVYPRAIVPLACRISSGMVVKIDPALYMYAGTFYKYDGTLTLDLTSFKPAAGKCCRVLVYFTPVTEAIGGVKSAEIAGINPDWPDPPAGSLPIAWIKLFGSTSSITEDLITDARASFVSFDADLVGTDPTAIHVDVSNEIHGITEKTTPSNDDEVVVEDSANGYAKVRMKLANLPQSSVIAPFFVDGRLIATTNIGGNFIVPKAMTILAVYISCGTLGVSGSTIVDIHKNGTTIFTTQANRPTLAYNDADSVAKGIPDVVALAENDILTLDIDTVATGAAVLSVVISFKGVDVASGHDAVSINADLDTILGISTQQLTLDAQAANKILAGPTTGANAIPSFRTLVPADWGFKLQAILTIDGELTVDSGTLRLVNHTGRTLTILGVYLDIETAPTSQAIIIDIHKNGTTIFTNQAHRPQIAAAANSGNVTGANIDINTWEDNYYLTMDRDQIGSDTPGSNLTVTIVYI